MNKEFSKMFMVCVLVEGVITYLNNFFIIGELYYQMVLSLALGIFIAVAYKIDLLKLVSIESDIPYVGSVLTGILFSRGSNYIYDILKNFNRI
ncbi:MAG: hypothetical protein IKE41_03970 [Clostridia bacterium]|nr:hypothetical protein [Clostridia bacterium]MBR2734659.1 hypothetical protein [Clostridia bacterium]